MTAFANYWTLVVLNELEDNGMPMTVEMLRGLLNAPLAWWRWKWSNPRLVAFLRVMQTAGLVRWYHGDPAKKMDEVSSWIDLPLPPEPTAKASAPEVTQESLSTAVDQEKPAEVVPVRASGVYPTLNEALDDLARKQALVAPPRTTTPPPHPPAETPAPAYSEPAKTYSSPWSSDHSRPAEPSGTMDRCFRDGELSDFATEPRRATPLAVAHLTGCRKCLWDFLTIINGQAAATVQQQTAAPAYQAAASPAATPEAGAALAEPDPFCEIGPTQPTAYPDYPEDDDKWGQWETEKDLEELMFLITTEIEDAGYVLDKDVQETLDWLNSVLTAQGPGFPPPSAADKTYYFRAIGTAPLWVNAPNEYVVRRWYGLDRPASEFELREIAKRETPMDGVEMVLDDLGNVLWKKPTETASISQK